MATCSCPTRMQLSGSMPIATLPSHRCPAALRMRRPSPGQRVSALSEHCGESLPSIKRQMQRHACKRGATATCCSASESAQSETELEPPADSAFSPLIRQETLLFLIQLVRFYCRWTGAHPCVMESRPRDTASGCFALVSSRGANMSSNAAWWQDFDRRLQRALNYENEEAAAQLREQREKLDKAVEEFQAGTACLACWRRCFQTQLSLLRE